MATRIDTQRAAYRDWFSFVVGINVGLCVSDLTQLKWDNIFESDTKKKKKQLRIKICVFIISYMTDKRTVSMYMLINICDINRIVIYYFFDNIIIGRSTRIVQKFTSLLFERESL